MIWVQSSDIPLTSPLNQSQMKNYHQIKIPIYVIYLTAIFAIHIHGDAFGSNILRSNSKNNIDSDFSDFAYSYSSYYAQNVPKYSGEFTGTHVVTVEKRGNVERHNPHECNLKIYPVKDYRGHHTVPERHLLPNAYYVNVDINTRYIRNAFLFCILEDNKLIAQEWVIWSQWYKSLEKGEFLYMENDSYQNMIGEFIIDDLENIRGNYEYWGFWKDQRDQMKHVIVDVNVKKSLN
jgi:hypothetical protein